MLSSASPSGDPQVVTSGRSWPPGPARSRPPGPRQVTGTSGDTGGGTAWVRGDHRATLPRRAASGNRRGATRRTRPVAALHCRAPPPRSRDAPGRSRSARDRSAFSPRCSRPSPPAAGPARAAVGRALAGRRVRPAAPLGPARCDRPVGTLRCGRRDGRRTRAGTARDLVAAAGGSASTGLAGVDDRLGLRPLHLPGRCPALVAGRGCHGSAGVAGHGRPHGPAATSRPGVGRPTGPARGVGPADRGGRCGGLLPCTVAAEERSN
jgi:hypothetical protein